MHTPSSEEITPRRIASLRRVPLFAQLEDEDLARVSKDLRLKTYERDEIIFRQGDHSRELYLIISGLVRIYRISPAGDETSINIFSTYDLLGEFAAIDNRPRSATAKAIGPTTLLAMTQECFLVHLREIPSLAVGMTQVLTDKVRWTSAYAEAVAQYDAAARLLHILLLYNERYGQELEAGKRYALNLGLNQSDLASLVGARREWVNRILVDWRKRGLIEYDTGRITICDLARVEAERDSRIGTQRQKW